MKISRRGFLIGSAALGLPRTARAEPPTLTIGTRILEVNGKAAKVFGITGPDGKPGLQMVFGERFQFNLKNDLSEDTRREFDDIYIALAEMANKKKELDKPNRIGFVKE